MQKKLRFLIVEDDIDILELVDLFVRSHFDCETVHARDGLEAMGFINRPGVFDLIISDFNMPNAKGDQLFLHLRKIDPSIPFLLVSSERLKDHRAFDGDEHCLYLDKPFTEAALVAIVEKGLKTISGSVPGDYLPVRLSILSKIQNPEVDLFLQIGPNKFVKVIHENGHYTHEDLDRFVKKGLQELYVKRTDVGSLLNIYSRQAFASEAWRDLDYNHASEEVALDVDFVQKSSKIFGWTPATVAVMNKNIEKVLALVEKNPGFKRALEIFRSKKELRLASHSVVMSYLMSECAKVLGWDSEITRQKIAFLCVLHDMNLDEEVFVSKLTLLQQGDLKSFPPSSELTIILDHPKKTAELVLNWPLCPPDVDIAIRQHHERPDGSGFPMGLTGSRISPLAALFIVVEDVVYHLMENFQDTPQEYLASKKSLYSNEPFRSVYKTLDVCLK